MSDFVMAPLLFLGAVVLLLIFQHKKGKKSTPSRPAASYAPPIQQSSAHPIQPWEIQKIAKEKPLLRNCPEERDENLRRFRVPSPEGDIYEIDTSDRTSDFYGPGWTRILSALENRNGDFIRGRACIRRYSRSDSRFSGYSVNVAGIRAFLPASKAGIFNDENRDATGKDIAVEIETVYPAGAKRGTIIVNAYHPAKLAVISQKKGSFRVGGTVCLLAADFDKSHLLFPLSPLIKDGLIRVPLDQALQAAAKYGIPPNPAKLTGYYWNLRITARFPNGFTASAVAPLL